MKQPLLLITLVFLLAIPAAGWAADPAATSDEAHATDTTGEEHGEAAEGDHGGGHGEESYFGIPGWILKLVNLIVFFGLLWYLVKTPLQKAFEKRREGIREDLQEAAERRKKADSLAEDIQKRLDEIEGEIDEILDRAREEGERQKNEIIASAEEESKKILATAESQIDQRLAQARRELTDYAGVLAAEKAKHLIEERVTPEDKKRFFRDSVEQVGEVES